MGEGTRRRGSGETSDGQSYKCRISHANGSCLRIIICIESHAERTKATANQLLEPLRRPPASVELQYLLSSSSSSSSLLLLLFRSEHLTSVACLSVWPGRVPGGGRPGPAEPAAPAAGQLVSADRPARPASVALHDHRESDCSSIGRILALTNQMSSPLPTNFRQRRSRALERHEIFGWMVADLELEV
jgi:hypothetical protein